MAVPQAQMDINPNLVQMPGYWPRMVAFVLPDGAGILVCSDFSQDRRDVI